MEFESSRRAEAWSRKAVRRCWSYLRSLCTDYDYFFHLGCLIMLFEIIVSFGIIFLINYTEIDWIAYMEEVEGFLSGQMDYKELKGGTGPLVYPAGFLYLFSLLRWITGRDGIRYAQFIWATLNCCVTLMMLCIMNLRFRTGPPAVAILFVLSKRIHSIFVLRLFNDCFAMAFLYGAILFGYSRKRWIAGSIVFSIALSIKMNVLLYLPGILCVLYVETGYVGTAINSLIILGVQILLGLPFLLTYPESYVDKAFEFSRVFFYKWTVNWKMLPEVIFLSKNFSLILLACHFVVLWLFAFRYWLGTFNLFKIVFKPNSIHRNLSTQNIVRCLFVSNFIGIVFSRTLHYQFYSWYFHTLPVLLFATNIPWLISLCLIFGIEFGFNVYPATSYSSSIMQVSHLLLLLALFFIPRPCRPLKSKYLSSSPEEIEIKTWDLIDAVRDSPLFRTVVMKKKIK